MTEKEIKNKLVNLLGFFLVLIIIIGGTQIAWRIGVFPRPNHFEIKTPTKHIMLVNDEVPCSVKYTTINDTLWIFLLSEN